MSIFSMKLLKIMGGLMPRFFLMNDVSEEEIQDFIDSGWDDDTGLMFPWCDVPYGDDAALLFAEEHASPYETTFYATILEAGEEDCIEYQLVNRGWGRV